MLTYPCVAAALAAGTLRVYAGLYTPHSGEVLVYSVVLYLGLIWQVLPMKKGASTTAHLCGFLGGIIAAWAAPVLRTLL